jgi:IS30 family transposase
MDMAQTVLDLREWRLTEDMFAANVLVSEIAAEIGRHLSTIYRQVTCTADVDEEQACLNDYYGMPSNRFPMVRSARAL